MIFERSLTVIGLLVTGKISPKCWLQSNYTTFHSQLVNLCKTQ